MARGFHIEDGGYVALLTHPERIILAQLAGDVMEMLASHNRLSPEDDFDEDHFGVEQDAEGLADPAGADDTLGEGLSSLDNRDFLHTLMARIAQPAKRPADSAILQLLPDASDDDAIAEEFRRFTEDDLRQHKSDRLRAWTQLLLDADVEADSTAQLPLVVPPAAAEATAGAMTDLRLVLADRLEIADEEDAEGVYSRVLERGEEPSAHSGDESDLPLGDTDDVDAVKELLWAIFAILGLLQESLVDCMITGLATEVTERQPDKG